MTFGTSLSVVPVVRSARLRALATTGAQRSPAPLTDHDVIRIGDAQLVVQPSAARIEVLHLAGNATVAPVHQHVLPGEEVVGGVPEAGAFCGTLSPREREVLQLVAEGKSSKEIALMLHLSSKTVEGHRRQIMDKLKLYSVA